MSTPDIPIRSTTTEIEHKVPSLYFAELGQKDPSGRWRLRAEDDTLYLDKSTGANWSSYSTSLLAGALGATCHVVASDALTATKEYATLLQSLGSFVFVCDGTNDDVQIQAAIDA